MNRVERRAQSDDAVAILTACDASTSRVLVAWAVGVMKQSHALDVHQLIHGGGQGFNTSGGTIGRGAMRFYDGDRQGFSLRDDNNGPAIVIVKWSEVAEVLDPQLLGADLIGEVGAVLKLRRERTPDLDLAWPMSLYQSAPWLKRQRIWAAVEELCYDVGAQVWARCRPVEHPEPTDLLELLAEMAA